MPDCTDCGHGPKDHRIYMNQLTRNDICEFYGSDCLGTFPNCNDWIPSEDVEVREKERRQDGDLFLW